MNGWVANVLNAIVDVAKILKYSSFLSIGFIMQVIILTGSVQWTVMVSRLLNSGYLQRYKIKTGFYGEVSYKFGLALLNNVNKSVLAECQAAMIYLEPALMQV